MTSRVLRVSLESDGYAINHIVQNTSWNRFYLGHGNGPTISNIVSYAYTSNDVFLWSSFEKSFSNQTMTIDLSASGTDTADNSNTISWWALSFSTSSPYAARIAGSVGLTGSGADLELEKVSFTPGQPVIFDGALRVQFPIRSYTYGE